MRGGEGWVGWMAAAALAGLVSACAGVPHDASLPIDDPNEQFNRKILQVNQTLLDPPSNVVKQVPGQIRDRLEDLDANLKGPRIFLNDILQARFNAAGITLSRFVFNTTFGLGGLFDVATAGGLPKQTGDFGQTLFVWGVPAGTFTDDALLRSIDAARRGRRGRRYGGRSGRLGAGRGHHWMAVVGRLRRPWGDGASRPMEGGGERLDRLL